MAYDSYVTLMIDGNRA